MVAWCGGKYSHEWNTILRTHLMTLCSPFFANMQLTCNGVFVRILRRSMRGSGWIEGVVKVGPLASLSVDLCFFDISHKTRD